MVLIVVPDLHCRFSYIRQFSHEARFFFSSPVPQTGRTSSLKFVAQSPVTNQPHHQSPIPQAGAFKISSSNYKLSSNYYVMKRESTFQVRMKYEVSSECTCFGTGFTRGKHEDAILPVVQLNCEVKHANSRHDDHLGPKPTHEGK